MKTIMILKQNADFTVSMTAQLYKVDSVLNDRGAAVFVGLFINTGPDGVTRATKFYLTVNLLGQLCTKHFYIDLMDQTKMSPISNCQNIIAQYVCVCVYVCPKLSHTHTYMSMYTVR